MSKSALSDETISAASLPLSAPPSHAVDMLKSQFALWRVVPERSRVVTLPEFWIALLEFGFVEALARHFIG